MTKKGKLLSRVPNQKALGCLCHHLNQQDKMPKHVTKDSSQIERLWAASATMRYPTLASMQWLQLPNRKALDCLCERDTALVPPNGGPTHLRSKGPELPLQILQPIRCPRSKGPELPLPPAVYASTNSQNRTSSSPRSKGSELPLLHVLS